MKIVNNFYFENARSAKPHHCQFTEATMQSICEMQKLADTYNFNEHPVKLYFFGDTKSGLQFRIECQDVPTSIRLNGVLKLYLKNRF